MNNHDIPSEKSTMNERRNEGITKLQEKAFYSDGLRKLVDR
jgi:hypothetical protein